ncbi:MAG: hypothetical protein HYX48_01735 [Chlamydiales bacterium]|nr:hypothetical protein [Chlamydiales bacterium]
MDISKYAAFFHDGSIMDVQHQGDKIEFFMASAEMAEEDLEDDIALSRDESIQGKLCLEGIISVAIGDKPFKGTVKKAYDNGRIFDFEVTKSTVELSVEWVNFPPKPEENVFSVIKIEAEKIWWENIPDLEGSI